MPQILFGLSVFCAKRAPYFVWLFNNMREIHLFLWPLVTYFILTLARASFTWADTSWDILLFFNLVALLYGINYRRKLYNAKPEVVCSILLWPPFFNPPFFESRGRFRAHFLNDLAIYFTLKYMRTNHNTLPLPPTLFLQYKDPGQTFNCKAALTIRLDDMSDLSLPRTILRQYKDFLKFIDKRKLNMSITLFIEGNINNPIYKDGLDLFEGTGIAIIYPDSKSAENKFDIIKIALIQSQSSNRISTLLFKMYNIVPDGNKYRFPKILLEKLYDNNLDSVDVFFQLIKLGEYIVHYRALCVLAHAPQTVKISNDSLFYPSFGTWNRIQHDNFILTDPKSAVESIYFIAGKTARGKINKITGDWSTACNILVNLRNRYVGHGTLTYSVSEEILYHLCRLLFLLLMEFVVQPEYLAPDDFFYLSSGQQIPCMIKDGNYLYCYAHQVDNEEINAEYFNYTTGDYQKLNDDRYVWHLLRGMSN